jgi:hypothetical protein
MALTAGAAFVVACGSRGASFPDGDKVEAAQKAWCTMLGELLTADKDADAWDDRSDCEGNYPTASAEFLALMTECFRTQAERKSGSSIDPEQIVADCTEQALVGMGMADAEKLRIVQARCERMKRCEDIGMEECLEGFEGLDPSERSRFTTMYNWGAQDDIASCLSSSGCTDDEDAARTACYQDAWEERVWLPDFD